MKQLTQRAATVELAIASALQDLGVTKDEVEVKVLENGRKGFLGFGAKDAEVLVTVLEQEVKVETDLPIKEETNESTESVTLIKDSEVPPIVTELVPPAVQESKTEVELESETVINSDQSLPTIQASQDNLNEEDQEVKKYNEEAAMEETKRYIEDMAKEMGINDLVITYETKGKYINFQLESEKAAYLIGKRGQTLNAIQQLAQLVANKLTHQFKIVRIDVADYRERREQSLEQLADRMADRAIRTRRQVALEPMPSYERKVIHNALSRRLDVETFSEGKDPYRHIVIKGIE
ncbi:RNA-binding cell elongation regulator Jag/EloR [Sporosarcina obsidiansis]|uniref:RNA-binding cell elongation regulator Jag/EloR n=1 Tax=Sporosarcina obsidiansis TaxID=2660748 RepID=UPI00129BA064|nr:RNA-binding cell elongation regulator Jag/EloR [Sporosarcina obsidiansis]